MFYSTIKSLPRHFPLYFSVWYLSFYCDPRIQLAVISKILMEGLLASARLYGEYMENYLWTEQEVEARGFTKSDYYVPGFFVYDVSSVISVWGWQLTYTALVPFVMVVEIISAVKTSLIRLTICQILILRFLF